ncbi:MAG: tight adherence protein [Acidimicrobiaceae bacterium]|jgi:Flp pilus assembly protein TadB
MNAVRRRADRELVPGRAPPPWRSAQRAREFFDVVRHGGTAAQIDRALPDALEAIARSLRSGASLRLAIVEASASVPSVLGAGLAAAADETAQGRPLNAAIVRWAATTPGDGVPLAAAALALGSELGGAAARSLDGVADTLRDRNGLRHEVRALSSQARASAVVIGLAPFVFSIVVAVTDPGSITFLLGSPIGLACLVCGLAADGLGAWWMRRIVTRAGADRDAIAAQQADVIDLFVLALGAGLNLRLALTAVARRAPPAWASSLAALVDQIERGQRVGDALDALPDALGEPARPLVRVLAGAERYGTPLLPGLDRLAIDARLDRRRRAEEAARRVPVKLLFPLVLCVLPAFGLLTVAPLLAGALDALRL